MNFTIESNCVGINEKPYIIAELSANHNGSIERAFETIKAAYESGADAVKIQTYTADTMTIDCNREEFLIKGGLWDGYKLYDLYKWAETPYEWHQAIFDYAKKIGITIFSTPFDETAVDLLESLDVPAYKVASFEMTDLPLIKYIARTGKPIIMSTGMASEEEIAEAIKTVHDAGNHQLVVLHCISSYPAPIEQANLRQMTTIAERFNVPVGLSDHTLGTTASITAVALGACVIEKHFTLSRQDKGPDSDFSIEPDELKILCQQTRDAWLSLGTTGFKRQQAEAQNKIFRRSIYFVKPLKVGETINQTHIRRIRPGLGLEPKYFDAIIGKKVVTDIEYGMPVTWDVLDKE
ncbi:pseudaminic acid synthase [Neisseria sp. Ec49-e6-T10]|uniref:pseudaminic acid synthase n=1 Tax=Neisseria sp. Ec49-e6-T10 TaxID=3140744 RepID=UPI003EBBED01